MGFDEEPFEGSGPYELPDIKGMAMTIVGHENRIAMLEDEIISLKEMINGMTIIQPETKNFPAMPRNRRNW